MRYAAPVAMPVGLGEWLGAELEARGVEAASLTPVLSYPSCSTLRWLKSKRSWIIPKGTLMLGTREPLWSLSSDWSGTRKKRDADGLPLRRTTLPRVVEAVRPSVLLIWLLPGKQSVNPL